MLLIQLQKILPLNQYTVIGVSRTFNDDAANCFEIFFAGPASKIPERYFNRRIRYTYPDKNSSQMIELE